MRTIPSLTCTRGRQRAHKRPFTQRTRRKLKLRTASPVVSQHAKHVFYQTAAWHNWTLMAADASSAFLQSDNTEEKNRLWTTGVGELAVALGVEPGSALRILKACYGLTTAPRIFWQGAKAKLEHESIGARPILGDQCLWAWYDHDAAGNLEVIGLACSHVDDFQMAGDPNDKRWASILEKIKAVYEWGSWKKGEYVYAGVRVRQQADRKISLDQDHYVDGIEDLQIDPARLADPKAVMTEGDYSAKSQPQLSARVGLLASCSAVGADLQFARNAQKLINETRKHRHPPLLFHTFDNVDSWQDFVVTTFADASGFNRPKHGRTGGLLVCFAGPDILTETTTQLSIIAWKSWRLERVCIDTSSAEVQAMGIAEGRAYKIRVL